MVLTVISIFFFQGLIFLGLIFMLRQFMKGNVKGELGHLQQLHDELMKRQAELKEKNEAAAKEYETKMSRLEQEITAKQTEANKQIVHTLEEAQQKAMKEKEKIINEALETREKMRREVMAEMEEKAIQYTTEILDEFFIGEQKTKIHSIMMDLLIDGIEGAPMEQFQINTHVVDLKVAQLLDDPAKQKLSKLLKGKIHKEVEFKEELDASLIGGAILRLGTFVIDGSMRNRLSEVQARLKKDARRRHQTA
jgi:F-type H+-transporting ATPase subunit delta